MDANIFCALLARQIDPTKFQLHGLDVHWLSGGDDTLENRNIINNVVANYDALAAEWLRDQHMAALRVERNRRLDEADIKYCNAERWSVMTEAQRAAWAAYKQSLRDLPATTEDPVNPVWPDKS